MGQSKYSIFVSYSQKDKALVHPFVEEISKAVGTDCWIDLKGIESGEEFENVIMKAIDECKIVLFMLSDSSLKSKWTKREVYYAEKRGKRLVPVIVDGNGLRGWFDFHFGSIDFTDIHSDEHKEKLVRSLRDWLDEEEEKRQREEKEKEEIKKKKNQEQQKLIADIELAVSELDNVELEAELKRHHLISRVQNVGDEGERKRLLKLIENSGFLYKKHREEIQVLTRKLYEAEQLLQVTSNTREKQKNKKPEKYQFGEFWGIFSRHNTLFFVITFCIGLMGVIFAFLFDFETKSEDISEASQVEAISSVDEVLETKTSQQDLSVPQTPKISIKATTPVEDNNTYSFTASIVGEQPTEAYHYELRAGRTLVKSSKDGTFVNIPPIAGGRYALHLVSDAGMYITSIPVRGFIDKNNPEPEATPASTQKMLITKEEFQQRMLNKSDRTLSGGRNSYVTQGFKVMVVNAESDDGSSDVSDIQDVRDMIHTYNKWQSARVVELEYDSKGYVTLVKVEPIYY